MPRYVLCPGVVISRTDGGHHYLPAGRLAWLYGVSMSQCVMPVAQGVSGEPSANR
jgi:hypothetical protein